MTAPPGAHRFLFVHLQKTAGTALLRRLRHHFGPDAVYPLPDEQGTPTAVLDVDHLTERLAALPSVRVVTGHFPLAVADVLPGTFSTFTVLRDPVERVLSFLRHQRQVEPRLTGASLEEIYAEPLATGPLVANHMVRMLSLTPDEMTDGALSPVDVDEQHLARARTALIERVDVVGFQDRFEEFCADLERTFSWDLGPPVRMNRTAPHPASAELREQIAADNHLDVRLHAETASQWSRGPAGPTSV